MKRALLLLRRATAAFYFTSAQVEKLLGLISNAARVRGLPPVCHLYQRQTPRERERERVTLCSC